MIQILYYNVMLVRLGAWIRQIDSQSNEKIVAMASQVLTDNESRLSNMGHECLAVTYGLERFEYY